MNRQPEQRNQRIRFSEAFTIFYLLLFILFSFMARIPQFHLTSQTFPFGLHSFYPLTNQQNVLAYLLRSTKRI